MDGTTQSLRRYFDNAALVRWATRSFVLTYLLTIVLLIVGFLHFYALDFIQCNVTSEQMVALSEQFPRDPLMMTFFYSRFAFEILSALLFFLFMYRAQSNLLFLGVREGTYSPAWAVGWFLFPVAFLWKPYHVMRDLYKASANPRDWQQQPVPRLLAVLWFLGVVLFFPVPFLKSGFIPELWLAEEAFVILSALCATPFLITMLYVMTKVNTMQKLQAENSVLPRTAEDQP